VQRRQSPYAAAHVTCFRPVNSAEVLTDPMQPRCQMQSQMKCMLSAASHRGCTDVTMTCRAEAFSRLVQKRRPPTNVIWCRTLGRFICAADGLVSQGSSTQHEKPQVVSTQCRAQLAKGSSDRGLSQKLCHVSPMDGQALLLQTRSTRERTPNCATVGPTRAFAVCCRVDHERETENENVQSQALKQIAVCAVVDACRADAGSVGGPKFLPIQAACHSAGCPKPSPLPQLHSPLTRLLTLLLLLSASCSWSVQLQGALNAASS